MPITRDPRTGVARRANMAWLAYGSASAEPTNSPTALVVEDVHWADRSTLDLLLFLVHNLLAGALLLVLTYRSDELHRRHPLRPLLAGLDRSGRAERLEVDRFGRADLADLLAGILGAPPAAGLTREREVLALVAAGRTNRQIAEALFISPKTATVHVSNILGKLGVHTRVEAAAVAHRLGIESSS